MKKKISSSKLSPVLPGAVFALGLSIYCAPSAAQTTSAAPTQQSAQSSDSGLEEITVTARRREESLQTVPVAVTAFSASDLKNESIVKLEDLREHTAGLQIEPSGFGNNIPSFTIRSQIQLEGALITEDPSVAVYFADVVQARPDGLNAALFDLSSVQVLKGPQGTLFGRNTTGGAVVITPQAPTDTFGGYIDETVGNYGLTETQGALNLPISDRVQLRIAGDIVRRSGYTYDPVANAHLDDAHTDSGRVSLKITPIDSLTNSTVASIFSADEDGSSYKLIQINPAGPAALVFPNLAPDFANRQSQDFHTVEDPPHGEHIRTWEVANTTEWVIAPLTVKNIFGYRHLGSDILADFSGTDLPILNSEVRDHEEQYSDEFQLLGNSFNDQLNWIVGAFWFKEQGTDEQTASVFGFLNNVNLAQALNKSESVFAQGTYKLPFLEGLSLTLGVRENWDQRSDTPTATTNGACTLTDVAGNILDPCTEHFSKDFNKPTWTAGLDYQIDPTTLVYFTNRRGYRSGGFNLRGLSPDSFGPFNPEIVTDYELGLKSDWLVAGTKLRTNVAFYYTNYSNIQKTLDFSSPVNGIETFIVNAASAKIKGVETEVTWIPIDRLKLTANYAYSDAAYSQWIDKFSGQDLSSNAFALSPRNQGSVAATWTQDLPGGAGALVTRLDTYYQSTILFTDNNIGQPLGKQGPYALSNARSTWEGVMGTKVDLSLFVKNMFNRDYYTAGEMLYNSIGTTAALLGPPRTYGAEVRYTF